MPSGLVRVAASEKRPASIRTLSKAVKEQGIASVFKSVPEMSRFSRPGPVTAFPRQT